MDALDIKQIRKNRGLTQKDLADLVGVNLSTVWRWENGQPPKGTARALLLQMDGGEQSPDHGAAA
ncbi:helix-turn-helix transcriptional regulator [Mesorhizobium sp. Pch-S]|uniref:helix-turn-helix domain-containing protein n=1 Tax=Mesorhizobium sp. Pch-S TaxID=2082387 RepID=UPI001010893B|nr:helix-turn-helix transcriptional regulator [Mesorhizobium sp. Pch-S]QAZ46787.1 transcriptional regulator [Mesorhizobium sp. Pch-S]